MSIPAIFWFTCALSWTCCVRDVKVQVPARTVMDTLYDQLETTMTQTLWYNDRFCCGVLSASHMPVPVLTQGLSCDCYH